MGILENNVKIYHCLVTININKNRVKFTSLFFSSG